MVAIKTLTININFIFTITSLVYDNSAATKTAKSVFFFLWATHLAKKYRLIYVECNPALKIVPGVSTRVGSGNVDVTLRWCSWLYNNPAMWQTWAYYQLGYSDGFGKDTDFIQNKLQYRYVPIFVKPFFVSPVVADRVLTNTSSDIS